MLGRMTTRSAIATFNDGMPLRVVAHAWWVVVRIWWQIVWRHGPTVQTSSWKCDCGHRDAWGSPHPPWTVASTIAYHAATSHFPEGDDE